MSTTTDEFFVSGLAHYGVAMETVESYRDVATGQLLDFLEERTWKRTELIAGWREDAKRYQKRLYIAVGVGCRVESQSCLLEVGFWWNREAPGVELYAGFHGDKDQKWRKGVAPPQSLRSVTSG